MISVLILGVCIAVSQLLLTSWKEMVKMKPKNSRNPLTSTENTSRIEDGGYEQGLSIGSYGWMRDIVLSRDDPNDGPKLKLEQAWKKANRNERQRILNLVGTMERRFYLLRDYDAQWLRKIVKRRR